MLYSVRLTYDATASEVRRVLREIDEAIAGTVWAEPGALIEGVADGEPAAGRALVEVEAPSRVEAHRSVISALRDADPDQVIITGGDIALMPVAGPVAS